jgi:hypothetical protein
MYFKAAKFVNYSDIPAYLQMGWIAYEPLNRDHHHAYGIVMLWLCKCKPAVLQ